MAKRNPIDVEELKKVFRIRNGNLERINYNYPNGKWTVVNKSNNNNGYCHVGVASYRIGYNDWRSQIEIDKNKISQGCYKTEQEAHEAYKIACKYIAKYTDNDSFRELIKKEMVK